MPLTVSSGRGALDNVAVICARRIGHITGNGGDSDENKNGEDVSQLVDHAAIFHNNHGE